MKRLFKRNILYGVLCAFSWQTLAILEAPQESSLSVQPGPQQQKVVQVTTAVTTPVAVPSAASVTESQQAVLRPQEVVEPPSVQAPNIVTTSTVPASAMEAARNEDRIVSGAKTAEIPVTVGTPVPPVTSTSFVPGNEPHAATQSQQVTTTTKVPVPTPSPSARQMAIEHTTKQHLAGEHPGAPHGAMPPEMHSTAISTSAAPTPFAGTVTSGPMPPLEKPVSVTPRTITISEEARLVTPEEKNAALTAGGRHSRQSHVAYIRWFLDDLQTPLSPTLIKILTKRSAAILN